MTKQLELVNELAARGRTDFTFQEARDVLGASPTATSNILRALTKQGLVDRVTHGHYSIRPIGALGTSAVSANLADAVATAFAGRQHRVAYRSALSELGLLSHPVRTVFVACTKQVWFTRVSDRPLRVVLEQPQTIHLGAEKLGRSWQSTTERALFECAMRVDLAGGVERLAEALASGAGGVDPKLIVDIAEHFGTRGPAAVRRLASLSTVLGLELELRPETLASRSVIPLDPRANQTVWIDPVFKVAWNVSPDDLRAVIEN